MAGGFTSIVQSPNDRVIRHLYGRVLLDASGQVVTTSDCQRFTFARNSAGVYTATLRDKYIKLLYAHITVLAAGVTPAGDGGNWKVNSAATTAATPTVVFMNETFASPGVAVDPQNSAELMIMLVVDCGRLA